MGVAQEFYTQFAQWLARQGYHVTTFDYRGIGLLRATFVARLSGEHEHCSAGPRQDWATVIDHSEIRGARRAAVLDRPGQPRQPATGLDSQSRRPSIA